MLSGEILSRPPLSVALVPPSNLIQLCRAMAAIASLAANQPSIDDDDIYLGGFDSNMCHFGAIVSVTYHPCCPSRRERTSELREPQLSQERAAHRTQLTSVRRDPVRAAE